VTEQPIIDLNDGVAMPHFGLGVYQTPASVTADVVRQAVADGYRLVDTASMYGNEEGVGAALRHRPDVFVTTKLGNADHGFDKALRAFDASARRLGREPVDLYLIHWPRPRAGLTVETWKALIRLRGEGRVRSIGVSNFNRDHLERIVGETGVTPSVNQIELHPRFQQEALRAYHAGIGVRTMSWSPLGRAGFLSDPTIAAIAAKHRKTPAQAVIRWHLDNGLIAIPKTGRPERLKENAAVFDFRLDADDLKRMRALDSRSGRLGPDPATATF
jgi:2,5-diketo-D-gluconate reductase A